MSQRVLASWYNADYGYKNNILHDGGLYYSELSKDYNKKDYSDLGNLPFWKKAFYNI